MMKSSELVANMIAGEPVDRVGLYEGFWDDTLRAWVQEGYPTKTEVVGGKEVEKPIDPFHHFSFDLHRCAGFFDTEPIFGYEELIDETSEWEIRRNGAGAALKWWKHKSGTPEHIEFHMSSQQVWEKDYRPHLLEVDLRRFNGKWWGDRSLEEDRIELAYAHQHGHWAWFGHVFVWEVMRASMGDLAMYENLLLALGWVHDFNRVYTDFFKIHFKILFEKLGLPDGVWLFDDIAYSNGLFASPAVMDSLFLPYYREIVSFFGEYGLPVLFHSDGRIHDSIPMLLEAGFVGLNPMERKAGCDPVELAEAYGEQLIFIGGFDVRIFETNDRDLIAKEIKTLLNRMKRLGAGYVFGSDHTITPRVQYDTYRFALDVFRENMWY